ncbi:MAG: AbrB family transcriptional regulator [Rhodospirillaceae bacterium]|nr:AbrB family transcriptional regulator [Rhodospirillaceae bacterium]
MKAIPYSLGSQAATLKALAIAAVGGAIAHLVGLPLAWMIGGMLATCAASVSGMTLKVPNWLRAAMVLVLGLLLGSRFTPDVLDSMGRWSISVAGLLPHIALSTGIGVWFLSRFARLDRTTAYFTAAPGGLSVMIMVGTAMGGDSRVIALSHATRVLLVVTCLPIAFTAFSTDLGPRGDYVPLSAVAGTEWLWLAACGIGWPLAARLRIPAAQLIGPLILAAVVHLMGWSSATPPSFLVSVAQLVVGASVGVRFTGVRPRTMAAIAVQAVGLTVVLVAVSVASALVLHMITGLDFRALVLAYSPGGLAELSLVALSLHLDPAFVALHHMIRIFLIVVLAPAAYSLMKRYDRSAPSGPAPSE